MCEQRKPETGKLTIMEDDAPVATINGDIKMVLGSGLYADYDPDSGTLYVGISDYWLDNKIKETMGIWT